MSPQECLKEALVRKLQGASHSACFNYTPQGHIFRLHVQIFTPGQGGAFTRRASQAERCHAGVSGKCPAGGNRKAAINSGHQSLPCSRHALQLPSCCCCSTQPGFQIPVSPQTSSSSSCLPTQARFKETGCKLSISARFSKSG